MVLWQYIWPVSYTHLVYDIDGVSLSMPAIVGADGIESDIPINLSGEEALKLKESADSLLSLIHIFTRSSTGTYSMGNLQMAS